jgi:O-succinylhomoserine sulfhydrylase
MAAVFNALSATLRAGDRVVAARGLFGSCYQILETLLPRWDIHTTFVDGTDLGAWERALDRDRPRAVFFETPSNPMQELIDVAAVAELAHGVGARVIVDNVFATPVFQRPLELGADLVVYSTTKHIDGQGRTLGGAILGPAAFMEDELKPLMRHTGPAMSPFNAWVALKGLETLRLRVERQTATARRVAGWLEDRPDVTWVRHPDLDSHPQRELARRQMTGGGSIVTFAVDGGTGHAFSVLDALTLIDISNNLGDAKTLVTHPATTTHYRLGPEVRAEMGVTDGVIRLSLGLEDPDDLLADLDVALRRAAETRAP